MAKKIYTHNGFYFTASKMMTMNGSEIYDEDGNDTGFVLNRDIDRDITLLRASKDTNTSQDDFKNILSCARKYAIDHNRHLMFNPEIAQKYNVQNFVVYNDALTIPMTGDEIKQISNENTGVIINIKKIETDNEYYMFYTTNKRTQKERILEFDVKYLYIVPQGNLHVDLNTETSLSVYSDTSDYSHIIHLENSKGHNRYNSVLFEYNKKDLYKLPKEIDTSAKLEIPTKFVVLEKKGTRETLKLPLYPPADDIKKHTYKINIMPTDYIIGDANHIINYVTSHKNDADFTKENPSILALNRMVDLFSDKEFFQSEDINTQNTLDKLNELKCELDNKFEHSLEM